MKKRILCLLLSAVLLFTLIPAVSANAASAMEISQEGVNLLKAFEGFSKYPYWDYSQYTVGYGTRCPDEDLERYQRDGITEEEAEALLRTYMVAIGKSINSFADKYGLTLNQYQFDALVLFSYNCGTGWLYEDGQLRSAVINGATGNAFIHPITLWCNAGGSILTGLVRRRLAEANLYLNGVYSSTPPSNYSYVLYDANGGKTSPRIQGYDSNLTATPIPVPTREGYHFDGWYTAASGGSKVSVLDSGVRNRTLYARWTQDGGSVDTTVDTSVGTAVNYRRVTTGTVQVLHRPAADAAVINTLSADTEVLIVAEYVSNGVTWGRINSSGWIDLSATKEAASLGTPIDPVEIRVETNGVNLRSGPGTNYSIVGMANEGDTMTITATATGSGYTWGQFDGGWIALTFTNFDTASKDEETPAPPVVEQPEAPGKMGTVTADSGLCIRSGAGTSYTILGYLSKGDRVEILEEKTSGSMTWGRISSGWISLDYVKLDYAAEEKPTEPETIPTEPETKPTEPETKPTEPEATEPEATEPQSKMGTITGNELRIRTGPSTGYSIVGYLNKGDRVEILEQKTTGSMTWGKISAGWISMDYVKLDDSNSTPSEPSTPDSGSSQSGQKGTVNASSGLRIRTGPSTSYGIVGYLNYGDRVTIQETKSGWGKISSGWISLDYVDLDSDASKPSVSQTKTVTADCLLIRSAAGTSNSVVGYLYYGEKVTITETTTVGTMTWGKISSGWISMDYVK